MWVYILFMKSHKRKSLTILFFSFVYILIDKIFSIQTSIANSVNILFQSKIHSFFKKIKRWSCDHLCSYFTNKFQVYLNNWKRILEEDVDGFFGEEVVFTGVVFGVVWTTGAFISGSVTTIFFSGNISL